MSYRIFLPAFAGAMCCATAASADPISGTILAIAGTVSASVGVGATLQTVIFFATEALLYAGLSAGLSYITQAIMGKPKSPGSAATGIQGTLEFGDNRPRSFAVGRFMTAGSMIYANTWTYPGQTNKPNEYLTLVIALSDQRLTGLDKIFVGDSTGIYSTSGATTPHVPGYSIPEFEAAGERYLWVRFYDGTQTTADPDLLNLFGADPNYPWTSAMTGTGMAYAIVTARFNSGVFSGFPQFRFEARGMPLYDPRADSSVGGSGAQRFDTPSTWAFSDNPAVIIYNILRGIAGPGGKWLYGLQTMSPSRLPLDNWAAAMNACDFLVDNLHGANEKAFRCGAEVLIATTPADVIDDLLQSCHGRIAEIGGIYKLNIAAAPVSSLSFTDDALMIGQPQTYNPFPSLDNTVNAITAKYPEPAESWNLKDAPPLYDAVLEAEDGGRRLPAAVQYNAVPYASQVQRLMSSALRESRKFRKHTIVLPPQFWLCEPNDTVSWTSPKNGYNTKLFRIDAMDDNDNLDVGMQLSECDPSDYDFDPGTDYTTPTGVTILPPFPPVYIPPNDLAVLLEAKAFLRNVQRLLDQYAEIAITHSYKQEWVLPGLSAGVNARVDQEITLRADGDAALAELVDQATAMAGAATANALIRWVAAAGPEGVVARLALESRATLGDLFTEAGLYIDAMIIDGVLRSQITLKADTIWLDADAGRVLLSSGGVTTQLLAERAATNHNECFFIGPTAPSSAPTVYTTLASVTHDAEGHEITFSGVLGFINDDNTNHGAAWRMLRDTTQIWPPVGREDITVQAFQKFFVPIAFAEAPAPGSYTYALQWKSSHANNQAFGFFLNIDEIKR